MSKDEAPRLFHGGDFDKTMCTAEDECAEVAQRIFARWYAENIARSAKVNVYLRDDGTVFADEQTSENKMWHYTGRIVMIQPIERESEERQLLRERVMALELRIQERSPVSPQERDWCDRARRLLGEEGENDKA
jgi:hypothetical protein